MFAFLSVKPSQFEAKAITLLNHLIAMLAGTALFSFGRVAMIAINIIAQSNSPQRIRAIAKSHIATSQERNYLQLGVLIATKRWQSYYSPKRIFCNKKHLFWCQAVTINSRQGVTYQGLLNFFRVCNIVMFKSFSHILAFLRSAFGLSPPSNRYLYLECGSNRSGGFVELRLTPK